jgi:hypothetical protein
LANGTRFKTRSGSKSNSAVTISEIGSTASIKKLRESQISGLALATIVSGEGIPNNEIEQVSLLIFREVLWRMPNFQVTWLGQAKREDFFICRLTQRPNASALDQSRENQKSCKGMLPMRRLV